jgi:hypothetical protein
MRVQTLPPDEQMALISAPGFGHLMPLLYGGTAVGADLERGDELDTTLLVLGELDDAHKALVLEGADRFSAIGAGATGQASAEAYIQAAELYRVAGDAEKRRVALDQAATRGEGTIQYAAIVAIAGQQADQGDLDGALARLRPFESDADRFVAQDAIAHGGALLEAADRKPEAITQYNRFIEKFPDTPMAVEIRARLERLGAPAAPAPEAPATPGTGG